MRQRKVGIDGCCGGGDALTPGVSGDGPGADAGAAARFRWWLPQAPGAR